MRLPTPARLPLLGLAAVLLSGCSLMPDYIRPEAPIPSLWPSGPAYRQAGLTPVSTASPAQLSADILGWRQVMRDPALQRLVGLALENNRDLRVAILNIESARATYRSTRSSLFPTLNGTSSLDAARTPNDLSSNPNKTGNAGVNSSSHSAGLGVTSYEIDLFGKLRSQSQRDFESYLNYVETRRSTQITLVAEVAAAYLTLLADRELMELSRQTLASQESSLALTRATVRTGTDTALTLRQAETSVESARASLIAYTRQVAQDENALALLLGAPLPADLRIGNRLDDTALMTELPAGLPSEVLLRRPDVLAAEHSLKAANADIGAARAAFFPSLSLTGTFGTSSAALAGLFTAGSAAWTFIPTLTLPIFSGGANEAALDLAKVKKNIAVANYEKAVQTAFREVADALAARGTYDEQIKAQQALTDAYADTYRLAEMRFRAGVDTYLTVLDAQRSLFSAQQTLISLRESRLSNLVTLYKVLGGGWEENSTALATR
ncbi:efflux transporter outer membrane subunit [Roseomonas sp. GC11]|uniref:efflux transporter outer membrane subunit n=1 Tax=Roseomonas sp. GC11 TaxID=2950546 RepID=UPI00210B1B1A|nr:efflux transporter outer membrane subunit [Roseomonas sp. GC11]MCQ4159370.1 efflux transporter outer membrane subunit [Roseomonas sp. GC11]